MLPFASSSPICVLVADDPSILRSVVSDTLYAEPNIEVGGQATDPRPARGQIKAGSPDVITLDVKRPCMGGLSLLRLLMQYFSLPVTVMNSATATVSGSALDALRLSASTGGTEALGEVLTHLPDGLPPTVFVQYIPSAVSQAFADRLDPRRVVNARETANQNHSPPRSALITRGNVHLEPQWTGQGDRVDLKAGPRVWPQAPPVDALFKSLPLGDSPQASANALTEICQGTARDKGALIFTRGEGSDFARGMPRQAKEFGSADHRVSIDRVASRVLPLCCQPIRSCSHVPA